MHVCKPLYILRYAPIQNAWVYIAFCAVRIKSDNRALGHVSIDYFREHEHEMFLKRSAVKQHPSISEI